MKGKIDADRFLSFQAKRPKVLPRSAARPRDTEPHYLENIKSFQDGFQTLLDVAWLFAPFLPPALRDSVPPPHHNHPLPAPQGPTRALCIYF